MPSFSQRHGYQPIRELIQTDSLDERTRNKLWNYLKLALWDHWEPWDVVWTRRSDEINSFTRALWLDYLHISLDNLPEFEPHSPSGAYAVIKDHFMKGEWFRVYDLLEFIVENFDQSQGQTLMHLSNSVLEQELCGFRFVGSQICPITDIVELEAIDKAAAHASSSVKKHLQRSIELLSDRNSPDYRNSIKEAICAVEALCQEITGDSAASLGKLLGQINGLHPAFSSALSKMYGFTSDAEGIRHALLDEPTLTFTDAKFFLVQSAAFINYIKGKQADCAISQ